MDTLFDFEALTTILSDESAVQQNLIAAARAMNEAVRQRNVEQIHACTQAYDTFSGRMEELEIRRMALCRQFSRIRLGSDVVIKLASIESAAEGTVKNLIAELGSVLRRGVAELTRLATENRILLEAHISGITHNIETLCQTQNHLANYRFSGAKDTTPLRRNLLPQTA